MKKMVVVAVLALGLVLMSMPAFALSLGTNITIYDGSSTGSGWYSGTETSPHEDQEVEPNCVANQNWDLEGFFLNGDTLTMVGGFNFADATQTYPSGDIFFDVGGAAGYDYALQLNFNDVDDVDAADADGAADGAYSIYAVTSGTLVNPYFSQNSNSTPWIYTPGVDNSGNPQAACSTGAFTYYTGLNDSAVAGLSGDTGSDGTHNAVAIDLGFLDPGTAFTAHFTMRCGNDNLMGQGTAPVPEPQTLLLMGIGLLGLAFVGRKKLGERA